MVSDFEMLNSLGKDHERSNKDKPVTSEQLSQRSFTLSNNKEVVHNNVTHITQSHAIVKTEKPIDTKPHNTSNMPTPPILTSPCYTSNQNMFSQSQQPFLGGLSLHLNHLIASRAANYDWPFGTLPFGLFGSNLDTRDLDTYPRTYSGHF